MARAPILNYMKIMALDIGDVWTGTAFSDPSGIIATPHKTVKTAELIGYLTTLFATDKIDRIVVGHPRTMKGLASEQTKKVEEFVALLKQTFPSQVFILWDERLSSKRAAELQKGTSPEEKMHSHSIAAAFILQSYLQYLIPD